MGPCGRSLCLSQARCDAHAPALNVSSVNMNAPQSYRVFVLFRKSDSHTSEAQRKGRSGNGVGSLPPRGLQLMSLLLRQSSPHRNMCTPRLSRPLSSRPPYPIDTPQILLRFGWSYWSSSGALVLRVCCDDTSAAVNVLNFCLLLAGGVSASGRGVGNWATGSAQSEP